MMFGPAVWSVDKVDITLTAPNPDACLPLSVPINMVLVPGGTLEITVFNGPIAGSTPTGDYSLFFDAVGPGGVKVGGGRSRFKISQVQSSLTDAVGDCLDRNTGTPAPAQACVTEFDMRAYSTIADTTTNTFYGRLDFRGGGATNALGPGQRSKSWNVVVGGGTCTFGRAIPGTSYVFNIEEQTFDQPGSPLRFQGLRCVSGSLQPDTQAAIGFRVGSSFVEMWGSPPTGITFEGRQGVAVIFGLLNGQPPVIDTSPVFTFLPGSGS